jgi:hypothetical protein
MPARRRSPSQLPARKQLLTVGVGAPWDRWSEGVSVHRCRTCGGYHGPIVPGSEAVCLSCLHTGRDEQLNYELALALRSFRARVARFRPRVRPERAPA